MSREELAKEGGIPRYRRIDILGGLLICGSALAIWLDSIGLSVGELSYFGPGLLPHGLAIALLLCGLVLCVTGFVQADAAAEELVIALRGPAAIGLAVLFFALSVQGSSIAGLRIPQFGLLLAGPLTVVIAGMGSREARPRELIVLGIALTALSVLVFSDALSMPLPVFPGFAEQQLTIAWGPDWPRRVAVVVYAGLGYGLWRAFGLTLAGLRDPDEGPGS